VIAMNDERVDCIVRFHDVRRLRELDRCMFSLVGQTHRPLHVLLALQRFTVRDAAAVRAAVEPLLGLPGAPTLQVLDWDGPAPVDGRAALLNLGLAAARGRYVGFLDYDDVLYPEAYEILVGQLRATGAAIAFATVRVVSAAVYPEFIQVAHLVDPPFRGSTLRDLLRNNFCPIHSFLIDRRQVPGHLLACDKTLTTEEGYDLLLRICARYPSNFELVAAAMPVGDYYYKTRDNKADDDSNTASNNGGPAGARPAAYERVTALLETRRRTTLVASEVQRALGVPDPRPGLTIRAALDLLDVP
jgi:glycosyl transferase family 2